MAQNEKILLTVITEAAIEEELIRVIKEAGAKGYTISDARGSGHRGDRSGDFGQTANIKAEILCSEATAEELKEKIKNRFFEYYAVIVFTSQVSVLRSEKFR